MNSLLLILLTHYMRLVTLENSYIKQPLRQSFNNPNGMCETCAGIGKVMDFAINNFIEPDKTYDEGFFLLPSFGTGKYYWKI